MSTSSRPILRYVLFCPLLILAATVLTGCRGEQAPAPPLPVPVIAAPVMVRDQPVYLESMGQALGSQDVEIRARVAGILESIHFEEGRFVKQGDLLYTIDPLPFQAALQQAKGNLAQAQAAFDKARRDVARLTPLWEQNAISRQMLDDAIASERATQAAVDSAGAAVEAAEIQLGYTRIEAPIDGLIGKTEVKPGNLVGQGASTLLTTMSSIDPIHFRFSVSEAEYLSWRRLYPDERTAENRTHAPFELLLADGTTHPHAGNVVFADRNVDPTTGTLLLEVAFPNPGLVVRPGQFGRVRVAVRRIPGAILVPQRAVQELQSTYSVFVVKPDNTVEFRKVTPGPRVGDLYVIEEGLAPGEIVVIEGVQKIRHNSPVKPEIRPAATDAPSAES